MSVRAVLALAVLAGGVAASAGANPPEIDYMLQCQGCHLSDGSGKPGAVPDLRNSVGRFLTVPGGRAYLVSVPGSATSALDDAALAAVLNWMIRRFGPADVASGFAPYDSDEVARLRRPPLSDVESVRRALLAALGDRG